MSTRGGARWKWKLDAPTILILTLLSLAIIIFTTHYQLPTTHFVYGFKYLFVPLILFLLFKNLPWEENFFERRVFPVLLAVSGIVALYGLLTLVLPQEFFTALGYSDAHSLYVPGSPLSAFQQISGTGIRRLQSTFAGPNQMGMWLLIPWSVGLLMLFDRHNAKIRKYENTKIRKYLRIYAFTHWVFLLISLALVFTFSRSAWIAAFAVAVVACFLVLRGRVRTMALSALTGVAFLALVLALALAPSLLLRAVSNRHHLERLREGISVMLEEPWGRGLGSAGPAAGRLSDACLFFDEGADISWAKDRPDLCLFVGEAQVQPSPSQKICQCPLLPENWYVQVGVELGVLGFVLFIALIVVVLQATLRCCSPRLLSGPLAGSSASYPSTRLALGSEARARGGAFGKLPAFLPFLGVSIAALFLHAWEDSAVAYTVWGMVGIALSRRGGSTSP